MHNIYVFMLSLSYGLVNFSYIGQKIVVAMHQRTALSGPRSLLMPCTSIDASKKHPIDRPIAPLCRAQFSKPGSI